MGVVFVKIFKGVDEIISKVGGLILWICCVLIIVDGKCIVDEMCDML